MHIQRQTKQRQIILEEIRRLTSHPTAAELHQVVKVRLPKISLSTVYRNLQLLTELGLVVRLETDAQEARYDGDITPHYHVRCVRCGQVKDVHEMEEARHQPAHPDLSGYQILRKRVEYIGICPACRSAVQNTK